MGAAPDARRMASSEMVTIGSCGCTTRRSHSPKFSIALAAAPTLPASNGLHRMTLGTVAPRSNALSNAAVLVGVIGRETLGPHFGAGTSPFGQIEEKAALLPRAASATSSSVTLIKRVGAMDDLLG